MVIGRLCLRLVRGEAVDIDGYLVTVKIDFKHPIDWFSHNRKLIERTAKKPHLTGKPDTGENYDQTRVYRLYGIKALEITRVVRNQNEAAVIGVGRYIGWVGDNSSPAEPPTPALPARGRGRGRKGHNRESQ